jgi:drug/metabolite transporter, DME family
MTARTARSFRPGTVLVALGAALWATDLIFRRGAVAELAAIDVVFWEHLILAAVCLPFLLMNRHHLRDLNATGWAAAIFVGGGASVLATILFTQGFAQGDPVTVLLLQKLQPLIAIAGGALLLGEVLYPRFWIFAVPAIVGAYLLAIPDPTEITLEKAAPALLGFGAAMLWGLGTVLGRRLLMDVPFGVQTSLRFCIGFPVAALFVLVGGRVQPVVGGAEHLPVLVALALVPGLLAVGTYYRGLSETPASLATLAELAFPAASVIVAYFLLNSTLQLTQWVGLVLVTGMITLLALATESRAGVKTPPPDGVLYDPLTQRMAILSSPRDG